ncbi:MAG: GntG family PLP-dependent aldolase [Candidatus Angelobacter sp.]
MENTGRIRKALTASARRVVFGRPLDQDALDELWHISRIDQAHLLMLAESGIVKPERTTRLLAAIDRLQRQRFAPLRQKTAIRGLFLLYEDYLIETEGAEVGGILQTARSRNDLNATVLKRRLRRPYLRLLEQALRLHAILLRRANRYAGLVMPVYTHGQAAMPTTYGHYLAGIAQALFRDLDALITAGRDIERCPLGAGAAAGTSFPIRTDRTAQLLGFDSGPTHSLDAVASRDLILRLLAAGSIYSLNLGRFATDLLQWTTAEFDFLQLPDELAGSSSAMPQKRNPFLLEHVQGRGAALTAAFVQALGSMHGTAFTNSIAVGTEAVKPVWGALQDLTEMVTLMRLVVAGAQPNHRAMLDRTVKGFTVATAFADHLVKEADLDFRTAHRLIGSAVLTTQESAHGSLETVAASNLADYGISISFRNLDPASVVRSQEFGGGPGPASLTRCLKQLRTQWTSHVKQNRSQRRKWEAAETALTNAVEERTACASDEHSPSQPSDHFFHGAHARPRTIELRSDTFTLPTEEMMAAIAGAALGDDGYREDPTVIRLEEMAAAKLGKEAACLTPSGTMANLAAILSHCRKGSIALVGDQSDIHAYEDQGLAGDAGVTLTPLPTQPDGKLLLSTLDKEFEKAASSSSKIALVCLENPHNLCGGVVLPLDYVRDVAAFVHARGARLHMDGARLFNAAVHLNVDPAEVVRSADSVQFCLSKGLAAPVGSVVAGSYEFIEQVRNKRQMLGGNMRQAGVVAAAGIVALEHMVERLREDHVNARRLAEALAGIPGIEVDLGTVQTNTVVFRVVDPRFNEEMFIEAARRFGLHISDFKRGRLRAVLHYGITAHEVEETVSIVVRILQDSPDVHAPAREVQAHS